MEFHTSLRILLLLLVCRTDGIPIPEQEPTVESTSPPTTTPDPTRLVFGFSNAKGEQKKVTIGDSDLPGANLTTLTDWLESLDQLKTFLQELLGEKSKRYEVKCVVVGADKQKMDAMPTPDKIQQSIKRVEDLEQKIESELRKPDKDWNYSAEKGEAVS